MMSQNGLTAIDDYRRGDSTSAWKKGLRLEAVSPAPMCISAAPAGCAGCLGCRWRPCAGRPRQTRPRPHPSGDFSNLTGGQVPDGGCVLRLAPSPEADALCAGGRQGQEGRCAVHHRGHEAPQRDHRRITTARSWTSAPRTATWWNTARPCSRFFNETKGRMRSMTSEKRSKGILPHREPMLLLDEAELRIQAKKRAAAANTPSRATSGFLQGHFPGDAG